jgi:hypothetical protein
MFMRQIFTIVLGRHPINYDEEDWPTKENTSCTYVVNSKTDLYRQMKQLISSGVSPWWWIFNGNITEDNLILSGAIDPDDIDIIKENLS